MDFATNPDREKWAPQEIRYVRDCDVVLANMRRVSIGTTLGIVRARQSGRPVVLLVSRSFQSPMLVALVGQHNVTYSVPEACARVASLVSQHDDIMLAGAGQPTRLGRHDLESLARLVSRAAIAGNEGDFGLEAIVLGELMDRLASPKPGTNVIRTWSDVELALRGAVGELSQDSTIASDLRKRLRAVRDAMDDNSSDFQPEEERRQVVGRTKRLSSAAEPGKGPASTISAQAKTLRARAKRLGAEHGPGAQIMQLLLPNLAFVPDSIEMILKRLPDPASVVEQLRELAADPRVTPGQHFKGTDWMELHASTGASSDGRIYYHGTRKKLVLVSLKRDQERDKQWLKKRSNWEALVDN